MQTKPEFKSEFLPGNGIYNHRKPDNNTSESTLDRKETAMNNNFGNGQGNGYSDEYHEYDELYDALTDDVLHLPEGFEMIPEETIVFESEMQTPDEILITKMPAIPGVDEQTADKISRDVDAMIEKDELPSRAGLKIEKKFDGLKDKDPDEREARNEYTHWYLNKDNKVLDEVGHTPHKWNMLHSLPKQLDEDGRNESAFNTADFKKAHPEYFDGEHWRTQNLLEKTFDIATSHAAISDEMGKKNQEQRFNDMLKTEFEDKIERESKHLLSKSPDVIEKAVEKIGRLEQNMKKAKRIWMDHAFKK